MHAVNQGQGDGLAASGRFVVRRFAAFAELPANYRHLSADMARENFSTSLAWFETFAATAMQEGASLRLYGIEENQPGTAARGLLVAQTPAARRGSVLARRRVPRHSLSGLTGYQTYLFAPMLRSDDPDLDDILLCLARHLRRERPRWELIDFAAMDPDSPVFTALAHALRLVGYIVRSYPHFHNVFEPTCARDYATYVAERPPSARKQIKNYDRKFRQLAGSEGFCIEVVSGQQGLAQAMENYAAVHAASWKEDDYHPNFLSACMIAGSEAGHLRLLTIYLNDRPAATQLVFLAGTRALFYRTAYDTAHAQKSVGAIAVLRMIEHLLEHEDVREIDFGRDREAYKRYFASRERTRHGLLAFDCRTLGGLRGLIRQLIFELKDRLGRVSKPLRHHVRKQKNMRAGV